MDDTKYTYIPADTQEWTRPAPLTQATAKRAVQYAAIAQAEALTRIAVVLEKNLDDAAHDGLRRLIQTTFGD